MVLAITWKGWVSMQKIDDNKNNDYYDLLLGVTAMEPDPQIVYLCGVNKAYLVPLAVLACQYKYTLLNETDNGVKECLGEALGSISPSLKKEMEALYAN